MKRIFPLFALIAWCITLMPTQSLAQPSYGNLPPLHVDGNYLRDAAGNKVVLHGVMDTPSPYFNSNRWGNSPTDANAQSCINYFNKLFIGITDSTQGAYCNLFRLHLDPCWTNDNNVKAKGFTVKDGKTFDPLGNEVGGEANIYHYSGTRLTKYLRTVYWRIAQAGLKHGLYIIMRPPGVCPGDIQVGTYYQDYLLDVWDRVTKNDSILKYYGHVGIELANEPVRIRNSKGLEQGDERFHDFFQPIVDKIRANGFKGTIWIPGGIWQQEYRPYGKFPITDPLNNIGYAVHDYPGWYGLSDQSYNADNGILCFGRSIPVVRTNPVVITEIDWSPEKEGTGHYNESGKWVVANYGTWATATTSKWGNAFKKVKEFYGNVSMTLSGTDTYMDWATYYGYTGSNKTLDKGIFKDVTPAFAEAMKANGLDPMEASGTACFKWYAEWAKENYPSFERYQFVEYPDDPFERSAEWFDPYIFNPINEANGNKANTAKHASVISTLNFVQGGCMGWKFDNEEGIDLSAYQTLTITLQKKALKNTFIRIYDNSCHMDFFANYSKTDMSNQTTVDIDLHNLEGVNGGTIDPAHIRMVCINSAGADQTLYLKSVTLSGTSGILSADSAPKEIKEIYSVGGMKLNNLGKGINIIKYNDGTTKKIYK